MNKRLDLISEVGAQAPVLPSLSGNIESPNDAISEALDIILSIWNPALERFYGCTAQEARERAGEALRKSDERYRRIIESAEKESEPLQIPTGASLSLAGID